MKKILFLLATLFCTAAFAQQTLTPVQIAERNKPGTVMIVATFKGTVSAIEPQIDEDKVVSLTQEVQDLVTDGSITQDQFWNIWIMAFCRDINKYMLKGTKRISEEFNTTMMGSGFIVTPDGYVITNAHVVDENDDDTKQNFVKQAFQAIINEDIKGVEEAMERKMTDEEANAITDANSWYFSQTMEVGNITKEFSIVFGISGDKGKIVPTILPAKLVTKGNSIPGKDVAILKITEKNTYPTIRMGDDKALRVGDPVYVLGYPGVATFHPYLSGESISEASLTRGLVSAKKNMKGGWEVLQTDAAITYGNSGGPVMNEQGKVIGLATFGSIDEQRQAAVQGMNFIVPSTIVEEFIWEAGIKPEMSDISLAYEAALDFFDKAHYKKALKNFDKVKVMSPSFPFIDKMIKDSKRNIEKGLNKEPKDMMYYIGGGVLLLSIILFFVLKKRKKA